MKNFAAVRNRANIASALSFDSYLGIARSRFASLTGCSRASDARFDGLPGSQKLRPQGRNCLLTLCACLLEERTSTLAEGRRNRSLLRSLQPGCQCPQDRSEHETAEETPERSSSHCRSPFPE